MTLAADSQTGGILAVNQAERASAGFPWMTVFTGVFILATVTIARVGWGNYVVKGLGGFMAAAFLLYLIRGRVLLSAEIGFYVAWVAWSLTGVFVARYGELFWGQYQTVIQIWLMLVIVAGLTNSQRALSANLLAFLVGVGVVGAYSWLTGEYLRGELEGERVAGLAVNSNVFGWIMILGTLAMAYFWMLPTRLRTFKYTLLILGMLGATYATVMSGSRKSVIGLGLFYLAWIWFCYRKQMRERYATMFAVLVGLAVLAAVLYLLASEELVGMRFGETWEVLAGQRVRGGGAERIQLYKDAWKVFLSHPIVGVGLGNVRVFITGWRVAHSEYMETLCAGGLVGFFLYFPIFVVMWRRAGKIKKHATDQFAVQVAGLVRAMLLVVFVMNFVTWQYSSKFSWIVFAALIGYTTVVWNRIRGRLAQAPASRSSLAHEQDQSVEEPLVPTG